MNIRWSLIAAQLLGRTDNDVKNHWNTKLKKKLKKKPFSHLMAEIATTLAPPQVAHLAEAALGCFKDEMLHLLTKKRIDFGTRPLTTSVGAEPAMAFPPPNPNDDKDDTIHRIKLGLSRAIMQEPGSSDKAWGTMMGSAGTEQSDGLAEMCAAYPAVDQEFRYDGLTTYGDDAEGSAWSQSMCTGSTCTGGGGRAQLQMGGLQEKGDEDGEEEAEGGKDARKEDTNIFGSDCVLWDLRDDLMNPLV